MPIDLDKFEEFGRETMSEYLRLYGWYCPCVSMHKVLIHGAEIMRRTNLPSGMLTEDGSEANNKVLKYFRTHRTNQSSRAETMRSLINRCMDISDPIMIEKSNIRSPRMDIPDEIRSFLM